MTFGPSPRRAEALASCYGLSARFGWYTEPLPPTSALRARVSAGSGRGRRMQVILKSRLPPRSPSRVWMRDRASTLRRSGAGRRLLAAGAERLRQSVRGRERLGNADRVAQHAPVEFLVHRDDLADLVVLDR